jgi:hypothetical protein
MKPEDNLRISIKALSAFKVSPEIIKDMLDKLKEVVQEKRNLQIKIDDMENYGN